MTDPLRRGFPRFRKLGAVALLGIVVFSTPALPEDTPTGLRAALTKGSYGVDVRYRFEAVSDDAAALTEDSAYASTLRTALHYRSLPYAGASVFVEFEDVSAVAAQHEFDNRGAGHLRNRGTGRPVVADVEVTQINQAHIAFDRIQATRLAVGRMEIALGDERFVGPVGWRQNHQSFDGVSLVQESIPRTKLTYAYVHGVHRIFGDHQRMHSHLFNAQVDGGRAGEVTPFLYRLDYAEAADATQSHLTFGFAWEGALDASEQVKVPFHLQLARQLDAGENPAEVSTGYARVELGATVRGFTARLGAEILEGGLDKGAFATPLATLHKFNGWADRFLSTPAAGLEDFYLALGADLGATGLALVVHDFRANAVDLAYGKEVDAQATWRTSWKQVLAAKLALYSADEFSADTVKLMVWTSYGF